MTINLADNTPRVSYAVAEGATQTSFTVSFEFFDAADLNVYVDGVLKTLTTNYTVSGGNGTTGTVAISVTGATGGSTVVITRDIDLKRTTDFPASGAFQIGSLNTELDKLIAIAADLDDKASRALQLTDFDAAVSLVLPDVNTRKGKTLAFNASTGAVEAGPSTSDVQTVSATAADIAALADIEDGTIATDAISGLAAIKTNVSTVAGIASNVTTVAGNTSNINAVAADASDIGTVASNISSVNTNASNISAIQGAAANAATASTKATEAAASAATASTQASNASTSAATSTTQATNSSNSATAAASSATAAASSASSAASSQSAAASSATAAAASQTAAAASAASAATAFDNFDDTYLGSKTSNPAQDNDGNSLVSGALYFNSTANEMRVYDGANWIAATSAGNVSLILYEYTATAGQTTFSGSDDNSATLSYTVDNLQVVMNGIVLDPSDFTATNGTSVVLASGAAAGDVVNIYAFKSFTTADMVSKTNGGTFAGAVTFGGGANFGGNLDANGNNILLGDSSGTGNNRIVFGAGSDFDLFHDGSSSNIRENGPGGLNLRGSAVNIRNIGNTEDMAIFTSNGAVKLFYNDVQKFATTSTGIDVTGTVTASGAIEAQGGNAPSGGFHLDDTGGTSRPRITSDASDATVIRAGSATGDVKFNNFANTTELVHIKDDGKVGIGASTVDRQLHVEGNRTNSYSSTDFDNTYNLMKIENPNTSTNAATGIQFLVGSNGSAAISATRTADGAASLCFGTRGGGARAERMRIDNAGNVIIGATAVSGPDGGNATGIVAAHNGRFYISSLNGANVFEFNVTGTGGVGNIHVNSSGTAYNTSSDYRLKQGVEDMTGAIDRVKALAPKRFNFIADADTTVDGFLAHEAQSVVPEAVTGTHNEVETWTQQEIDDGNAPDGTSAGDNKLDGDGNTIPVMQGIDQSKLVPLLTGALKEAIAKIETLETKVAALEAGS